MDGKKNKCDIDEPLARKLAPWSKEKTYTRKANEKGLMDNKELSSILYNFEVIDFCNAWQYQLSSYFF